jgi:hypothetical protein
MILLELVQLTSRAQVLIHLTCTIIFIFSLITLGTLSRYNSSDFSTYSPKNTADDSDSSPIRQGSDSQLISGAVGSPINSNVIVKFFKV